MANERVHIIINSMCAKDIQGRRGGGENVVNVHQIVSICESCAQTLKGDFDRMLKLWKIVRKYTRTLGVNIVVGDDY